VGASSLLLVIFGAGFALTALLPFRWPWLAGAGVVGALAWSIGTVANGCERASEVRCGWQPVVAWIFALLFVAACSSVLGSGVASPGWAKVRRPSYYFSHESLLGKRLAAERRAISRERSVGARRTSPVAIESPCRLSWLGPVAVVFWA
jgi:hypothetical protein